jgi:hypothetical protein
MLIWDAMVKTDLQSVGEYIASQPEAVRSFLERVRSAILKAVPGAEEVIIRFLLIKFAAAPSSISPGGSSTVRSTPRPIVSSRS